MAYLQRVFSMSSAGADGRFRSTPLPKRPTRASTVPGLAACRFTYSQRRRLSGEDDPTYLKRHER